MDETGKPAGKTGLQAGTVERSWRRSRKSVQRAEAGGCSQNAFCPVASKDVRGGGEASVRPIQTNHLILEPLASPHDPRGSPSGKDELARKSNPVKTCGIIPRWAY